MDESTRQRAFANAAANFSESFPDKLLRLVTPGLRRFGVSQVDIDRLMADSERTQLPIISDLVDVINEYMNENIRTVENARKVRPSDGGDMVHSIYARHCDIWRGDRYSTDLIARSLRPIQTCLVSRLVDLPEAIDDALSKKGLV